MSTIQNTLGKMSNYRWTICAMLFFATTVNYLDRQVLSLTWNEFITPEFHWDRFTITVDITAVFSIVYALPMLFAGRFIDWLGSKKGYLWAIFVWSLGACLHALCGIITEHRRSAQRGRIWEPQVMSSSPLPLPVFTFYRCPLYWVWVKQETSPQLLRSPPNISRKRTVHTRLPFSMPALYSRCFNCSAVHTFAG